MKERASTRVPDSGTIRQEEQQFLVGFLELCQQAEPGRAGGLERHGILARTDIPCHYTRIPLLLTNRRGFGSSSLGWRTGNPVTPT